MSAEAAGGFAGSFVGPALQYQGQRETNAANLQIAREQMRFQQASAREAMQFEDAQARSQMKFQDRMSSSAYQRSKEDLKKAGFNPLLALGNPAATPTGASGSGSSAQGSSATMGNALEAFSSSGSDVLTLLSQLKKQKAETDLVEAQKNNVNMDTAVKAKGIPEAELKNKAYDVLRPLIEKIKDAGESGARWLREGDKINQQRERERNIPIRRY